MKKILRNTKIEIDISHWMPASFKQHTKYFIADLINGSYRLLGCLFIILSLQNPYFIIPFMVWLLFDFRFEFTEEEKK